MANLRRRTKELLARIPERRPARGSTLLIWHRVGGGTTDELDVPVDVFEQQLDLLAEHDVVSLDDALARLDAGDDRPTVVLTFDDGFADVHTHAHPRLCERGLPYTVYLAAGYVGRPMKWEGATSVHAGAAVGMTWEQLAELAGTDLCTIGNHTYDHARPEALDADQLDRCSDAIDAALGCRPAHFAYPWGVPVPEMREAIASRFRSAATGDVGRNLPADDPYALRRVPVRRTDPLPFFAAKLTGTLRAERGYARIVDAAKRARRG